MANGVKEEDRTNGVKVVGAPVPDEAASAGQVRELPQSGRRGAGARRRAERDRSRRSGPTDAIATDAAADIATHATTQPRSTMAARRRRGFALVSLLAVAGLLGTVVFGLLWAGKGESAQDPAMISAAKSFMTDLTNFNAKSIDADFTSITSMATGTFSGQASKFFNSSIRSELQDALAESRGQIRDLYVQSESGNQGSVYVVDDQEYANNKITTPQSDVLRVVVDLQKVGAVWKISDVTVLEGATPASTGTPSGSAGSNVPGQ